MTEKSAGVAGENAGDTGQEPVAPTGKQPARHSRAAAQRPVAPLDGATGKYAWIPPELAQNPFASSGVVNSHEAGQSPVQDSGGGGTVARGSGSAMELHPHPNRRQELAKRHEREDGEIHRQPERNRQQQDRTERQKEQGGIHDRDDIREVQGHRGGPAGSGARPSDTRGVVRGGSERRLAGSGRADNGVRGGVRDGDLGRGRREDHDSQTGLGLHSGKGGSRFVGLLPEQEAALLELEDRLNLQFRNRELLQEAMTHSSWANENSTAATLYPDNERLEYLGDAVLELVVAEHLFRRFPDHKEGRLTQQRAALVNTISLSLLAGRLGLGSVLLLGKGATKTRAAELPSLLANGFEALMGAIFLEHGYAAVTRLFFDTVGDLADWDDMNFKGRLQEVAQELHGVAPVYRATPVHLEGKRRYHSTATVAGVVVGEGDAATKQAAEQAAAEAALGNEFLRRQASAVRRRPASVERPDRGRIPASGAAPRPSHHKSWAGVSVGVDDERPSASLLSRLGRVALRLAAPKAIVAPVKREVEQPAVARRRRRHRSGNPAEPGGVARGQGRHSTPK